MERINLNFRRLTWHRELFGEWVEIPPTSLTPWYAALSIAALSYPKGKR